MPRPPRIEAVTYEDFLEETYRHLRDEFPIIATPAATGRWLHQAADVLVSLPEPHRNHWLDQYAALIVCRCGGIDPAFATACLNNAMKLIRDEETA